MSDTVLRVGEVRKILAPDSPDNFSKSVTEYEVAVQYREGGSSDVTSIFRGVTVSNMFGGIADMVSYTLRADPTTGETSDNVFGVGSKVLLLCVSGSQQKAIIIGGIRDFYQKKDNYPEDVGHNFYFEFNGIRFQINDDGEATATFRGKTNVDGTLADSAVPEAEGTTINLNKEGNAEIATPEKAQFVRVNHKDKKIEVLADTEWNVEINGKLVTNVGSTAEVTVGDTTKLDSGGIVSVTSPGVHVGDATDAWMLGTTYRNGESQMNTQLSSALMTASIALTTAAPLNAIPIIGGILAAPLFITIATQLGMMSGAVQTFEGQAPTYLSKKNLTD